jgi:alkylation response protein AidB-like acyl-CoA dehydrogenase
MSTGTIQGELFRTPPTQEVEEWQRRVKEVTGAVEENRKATEKGRAMPRAVFQALRDAGFTRMWVSSAFGGGQASVRAGSAAVQALAQLDASIAWQIGVQGAIGRLSDYLSEPVARELFEENDSTVVGGVNPAGRAVAVEGGYRVSGEWGFASGSAHAEWMVSAAFLYRDEEATRPIMVPGVGPAIRMVFVPRDRIEMLDTWYTVGLRGTGSNHYRMNDVFVPEQYAVDQATMLQAPPERASRGYAIGYYDFGPFTSASTAIGIAQDALDTFRDLALRKTPTGGASTLATSHTVQDRLARAEMLVHSARTLLSEAADRVTEFGESGGTPLSALVRLTTGTVAENTVTAVNSIYTLAGSSSLYETSRLERCFRDVNSAVKHITLAPSNIEMVGLYLLSGELKVRR